MPRRKFVTCIPFLDADVGYVTNIRRGVFYEVLCAKVVGATSSEGCLLPARIASISARCWLVIQMLYIAYVRGLAVCMCAHDRA